MQSLKVERLPATPTALEVKIIDPFLSFFALTRVSIIPPQGPAFCAPNFFTNILPCEIRELALQKQVLDEAKGKAECGVPWCICHDKYTG